MENIGIFVNGGVPGLLLEVGKQVPHYRNPDYWNPAQHEKFDKVIVDTAAGNGKAIVAHYEQHNTPVESFSAVGSPSPAKGEKHEERAARPQVQFPDFNAMSVKEMREYAKERNIQLPAQVNTRDEITAHLMEELTRTDS